MTLTTRAVAEAWFDALDKADYAAAMALLHPDIVWINVPQVRDGSDIIPWIGTAHGLAEVTQQFSRRDGVCQVKEFKSIGLVCEGNTAVGLVRDKALIIETGITFDIVFASWMTIEDGLIVRWKSYCDTAPIVAAFKGIEPPLPEF
jgi:ketosteroid isomerase-like protein